MSSIERGGLLSRVADTLYLIGRYLERAEHGARLLDVHTNVALDLAETTPEWRELIALCQDDGGYPANWPIDGHWVARFVVHYEGNRNSILACLSVARENTRGVRGAISSELWEQINALHRAARHDVETGSWLTHTHAFLQSVKQGAHLFHGIADETMLHDEGGAFLRLGKNLERAVNTARLVATKAKGLTRPDGEPDLARCAALLKMCSGFEAYRRYYAAPVEPVRVIEFLLLNQTFPRSALWSVNRAADEGRDLARQGTTGRAPERLLGSLHAQLAYAGPDDLAPERLGDFLARFLARATEVEHALVDAFFPRDGRPRVVGRQAFAPQQQQQQQ
ncbi:MAG: alpha-E domain-containing protein [Chloroflexota bacterium]|nr:MAG: alpha-E domain-containing protein [Chloroflexota bacterium]